MDNDAIARLDQFTSVISLPSEDGSRPKSYQLAGAGARTLAGVTDLLLQMLTFAGLAWLAVSARPDLFPEKSWVWAAPVAFVEWHIIYLMLFESFTRGTTPGKHLWRLRVISSDGAVPGTLPFVVRNVARVVELLAGAYLAALVMITLTPQRQRLGDRFARTLVIFNVPLVTQLFDAEVPESLYSTSEDGYLLESWMKRERRFEPDSRVASSVDLAVYLHGKYDAEKAVTPEPATYLRHLYEAEHKQSVDSSGDTDVSHPATPN